MNLKKSRSEVLGLMKAKGISYELDSTLPPVDYLSHLGVYYMGGRFKRCRECKSRMGFKVYKFKDLFYMTVEGNEELIYTVEVQVCRACKDLTIRKDFKITDYDDCNAFDEYE